MPQIIPQDTAWNAGVWRLCSLALVTLLAACDGGGSSGSASNMLPPNTAPTITSPSSFTIASGQVNGVRLTATDTDNDPLTFTIAGGDDANSFVLSATGDLSLKTPLYSQPADADYDNVYRVTITVSDGKASASQDVTVTVQRPEANIAASQLAEGFVDPVSIIVGLTTVVAQKNGEFYLARNGVKELYTVALPDAKANGLLRASSNPVLSRFQDSLRTFYLTNAGTLVATSYSFGLLVGGLSVSGASTILNNVSDPANLSIYADYTNEGSLFVTSVSATQPGTEALAQDPASPIGKLSTSLLGAPASTQVSGVREVVGVSYAAFPTLPARLAIADRSASNDELNSVVVTGPPVNLGWPFKDGTQNVQSGAPAGLTDPLLTFPRNVATGQVLVGSVIIGSSVVLAFENGNVFTLPTTALNSTKPLTSAALVDRTSELRAALPNLGRIALIQAFRDKLYIINAEGTLFEVRWLSGL